MAITTRDELINALGNNSNRIIIDKATIANQLAGTFSSLWRATGQPAQGAIPTTAAIPTSATTGAMGFANQTSPVANYVAYMTMVSSIAGQLIEIHDRVAHMGGLLLNTNSAQTTNLPIDLQTLGLVADRRGDADYSNIQWWLEVYSDGGATASNATINVTFDDNSTGNLNTIAVGGTIRAGRMYSVDSLRTTAQQGLNIRGINSVTLSASTTVAGNFGFTATRPRTSIPTVAANYGVSADWAALGLPMIPNDACLQLMVISASTSTGIVRGNGKIIYG